MAFLAGVLLILGLLFMRGEPCATIRAISERETNSSVLNTSNSSVSNLSEPGGNVADSLPCQINYKTRQPKYTRLPREPTYLSVVLEPEDVASAVAMYDGATAVGKGAFSHTLELELDVLYAAIEIGPVVSCKRGGVDGELFSRR